MSGRVNDYGKRLVYDNKEIVLKGQTGLFLAQNPELFDHFVGDTLNSNLWAANKDTGATDFAINVQKGGVIRAATGTTDNDKAEIAGEIIWQPSTGPVVFESRLHINSAVTTVAVNVGLSDAKNEAAQTIAMSLATATLTTTASNGCMFLFDTDATNDNWHFAGVKANTDAGPTNTAVAPVADTYQTFRIELDRSGNAVGLILDDDRNVVYRTFLASATTAATLLCPYIAIQARTTTDRTIDVDYIYTAQSLA